MWQKRKELIHIIKLLTFQRFWNLHKLIIGYWLSIIFNKPFVFGQPFSISIEPTTICNLSCAECPTGNKSLTRSMGEINAENFKQIINQVYKKTFYLNLYLQGEPFLHSQLTEMISYAANKKMFICVSTNGHFLDDETCKKLIKSGLQKLIISVDGATNDSYNKYRKNGNLTKVIDGIKSIAHAKIISKSDTPEIVIQMLISKYNEHEISLVKQITKETGANRLELKTMQIYNDSSFLSKNKIFNRYIKDNKGNLVIKNKLHNWCKRLWTNAVITWDGKLIPCCYDKNADNEIGSILNSSFETLWKNKEFNSLRKTILNNRKSVDICRNCTE